MVALTAEKEDDVNRETSPGPAGTVAHPSCDDVIFFFESVIAIRLLTLMILEGWLSSFETRIAFFTDCLLIKAANHFTCVIHLALNKIFYFPTD